MYVELAQSLSITQGTALVRVSICVSLHTLHRFGPGCESYRILYFLFISVQGASSFCVSVALCLITQLFYVGYVYIIYMYIYIYMSSPSLVLCLTACPWHPCPPFVSIFSPFFSFLCNPSFKSSIMPSLAALLVSYPPSFPLSQALTSCSLAQHVLSNSFAASILLVQGNIEYTCIYILYIYSIYIAYIYKSM
jgi:hypothetical protein